MDSIINQKEFKKINNLDELESVTTMDDECNPVKQILSLLEVHRTHLYV